VCRISIGYPIPRFFTIYCVVLNRGPSPPRVQRYDEPPRHPKAPGPSLAFQFLTALTTPAGFPVLRTPSLHTCRRHPAQRRVPTLLIYPDVSAFPERVVGSACARPTPGARNLRDRRAVARYGGVTLLTIESSRRDKAIVTWRLQVAPCHCGYRQEECRGSHAEIVTTIYAATARSRKYS
jgi:hypothetical protein